MYRSKIVTIPARQQQNEARREAKAQVAAQLENSIEHELLERLRSGTYDNHRTRYLENYTPTVGLLGCRYFLVKVFRVLITNPLLQTARAINERSHLELEYERISNEN